MNALKPMGLLASGRMIDSTLLRVPHVGPAFGPIVAGSKRLASRYANTLRFGHPAGGIDALAPCRLIWLQVPPHELGDLQLALLRSTVLWKSKTVVLLDPDLDCSALAPLAASGAAIASLTHVPLRHELTLLAEGDSHALRALRPLWKSSGTKILELKPGLKQVYTAGLMAADTLTATVVDSALSCLRAAGLDPATAKRLAGALIETSIRNHLAHGRKSWISPASLPRREITIRQIEALHRSCPEVAIYLRSVLNATLAWYDQPADWLDPG
jgi:predicted short-subunit dehydrogenase-like oxidoreductase (DUF2520 family)